ncbi:hypothetical protein OBBRIDRAFT_482399 [Obba rivulosa]|uniref:Uncharacterized protein n=1 Tax=Obba rivulosa TaxID=1052685 RepID=A0A8E2ANH9_9APHY|nr:hypothetical protein OBBRIDRAFT_482399 [Obba rivulosa]
MWPTRSANLALAEVERHSLVNTMNISNLTLKGDAYPVWRTNKVKKPQATQAKHLNKISRHIPATPKLEILRLVAKAGTSRDNKPYTIMADEHDSLCCSLAGDTSDDSDGSSSDEGGLRRYHKVAFHNHDHMTTTSKPMPDRRGFCTLESAPQVLDAIGLPMVSLPTMPWCMELATTEDVVGSLLLSPL